MRQDRSGFVPALGLHFLTGLYDPVVALTTDNANGLLPEIFEAAGFHSVRTNSEIRTVFGTLALYSAVKPG